MSDQGYRLTGETELARHIRLLYALARARSILTDASDWAAWEAEMRQDVPQDAIEYMGGEDR